MAPPTVALRYSISFRDSKGNTSKTRFLVGGATVSALNTAANGLVTALQAVSNAHVYRPDGETVDHTYGTTAQFANVEDKMVLTFLDVDGGTHRFQVPAPLVSNFYADQETVNNTGGVATLTAAIAASVYATVLDTAPLSYVGGIRVRKALHRKANIFTKDPTLTEPEE